jgi:hypothetical protein
MTCLKHLLKSMSEASFAATPQNLPTTTNNTPPRSYSFTFRHHDVSHKFEIRASV